MRLAIFTLLLPLQLLAATDWLCTEEASQRKGNAIYSCGIGKGSDENIARSQAFDNAKAEFSKVCGASDDCKGRPISVEPQRTSCEKEGENFKCYRLVVFTIGIEGKFVDKPDSFKPFTYDQISEMPKIKKGMKRSQVLSMFGEPTEVIPKCRMPHVGFTGIEDQVLIYTGANCNRKTVVVTPYAMICLENRMLRPGECAIGFDDGEVVYIENFDYHYTEDLK